MNAHHNKVSQDTEKLKEIPKWARRYAESRTIHMVIFFIAYLILLGMVYLSIHFFVKENFILAGVMLVLYLAGLIYFLVSWDKGAANYYAKTGIPESSGLKQMGKYLPIPLIAFIVIGVIMENRGVFPAHQRVPISAVFVCPMLIFANWRWLKGSFIGYLWAGLYGAWAVAILFKVPLLTFSGKHAGSEMILAVPVTGLITGLVGYIYSQYALKKLKSAAHLQENTDEQ